MIATAPAFFAEILFDGALSVGLYRRLRAIKRDNWLEAALRRTAIPFMEVMIFFVLAGLAMHHYAPDARSIGGVWQHVAAKRR